MRREIPARYRRRRHDCTYTLVFSTIGGADGRLCWQSECAAMIRGLPLSEVIEETRALRQSTSLTFTSPRQRPRLTFTRFTVDIRGDATGYLTDGTAPFLSLQ